MEVHCPQWDVPASELTAEVNQHQIAQKSTPINTTTPPLTQMSQLALVPDGPEEIYELARQYTEGLSAFLIPSCFMNYLVARGWGKAGQGSRS